MASLRIPLPSSKLVTLSIVGAVLAVGGAVALASPAVLDGAPMGAAVASITEPLGFQNDDDEFDGDRDERHFEDHEDEDED